MVVVSGQTPVARAALHGTERLFPTDSPRPLAGGFSTLGKIKYVRGTREEIKMTFIS